MGLPASFFPDCALRDLFGWVLALGVLAAVAALFPWELGVKADPFAPAFKTYLMEQLFVPADAVRRRCTAQDSVT